MMIKYELIKTLALFIFQSIWRSKEKAFSQFSETFQQTIFRASKQYHKNYIERHGLMKVLGMKKPMAIDSVYVEVNLLDNENLQKFDSIATLERAYRDQRRGFFHRGSRKELGLNIANEIQYLMVLGGPGIGKSTFLRKIGLEALSAKADRSYEHACIPVFIELKESRSGVFSLESAIGKEFSICGFPDHESFTAEALRQGKLLILLDGLDEVPEERLNEVIYKIQNFVDLYDKNRFIISCRTAAYRYNFRRFTDVTIAEFDDEQIYSFIMNWFSQDMRRGEELWQKLITQEYVATKELAHTPLLLTLTCLLYQRAGQFPTNRATLYEKALRVLLEEWAGEKGLAQEKLYRGLDTKRKEMLLSEIAHSEFQRNHLFFSKREVSGQIESVLADMLPNEKFIDGRAVLKAIEIHHGILIEHTDEIYSFSHLTFQEFLTAQYLVDDISKIKQVIQEHLTDGRWREVFLLLAGLKQADDFLRLIEQQIQTYISTATLQCLLRWADKYTIDSPSHYKPAAKRAIAIFLALSLAQMLSLDVARLYSLDIDIDRARELALSLDESLSMNRAVDITISRALNIEQVIDLSIAIAQRFEKMQIFRAANFNVLVARLRVLKIKVRARSAGISVALRKTILEYIYMNWLKTLNLKQEWLRNLSREERSSLNKCLSSNLLLVECRKSAVRVSRTTWDQIENRILKVAL